MLLIINAKFNVLLYNRYHTFFFSCINTCRVPKKQFEPKATMPRVQTPSCGLASVHATKETFEIVTLATDLVPTTTALKTLLKY